MIVPIIYEMSDEKVPYLWVFYKYMDFSLKNNYPIIALEDYFTSPSVFKENQNNVFKEMKNGFHDAWEFEEPSEEKMTKLKKYSISKQEENKMCKNYKTKLDALTSIIKERNEIFEQILQKKIDQIEKDTKEKIDVILTWVWSPSLDYIAKKNNIKVITEELSTYRKYTYNKALGYFTFENKYNVTRTTEEYKKFLENKKEYNMFSRKELLTLFLSTNNLKYVKMMSNKPIYEFGIDLGTTEDPFINALQKYSHKKIINKCISLVGEDRILCRTHPVKPSKTKFSNMDNSPNSIEWMIKCQRIVSSLSNIGFEAMLYGRSSYILCGQMPFIPEAIENLTFLDEHIASVKFLNYITFAYFVPYELLFDKEYIEWRSNNKLSIKEIYDYNLNYLLEKSGLTIDIFKSNSDNRIKTILKKVHGFTTKEANDFVKELNSSDVEILEQQQQKLIAENHILKQELDNIVNSKGWKVLNIIRKLKPFKNNKLL